jgi:hypothetical protein
VRKAGQEEVRDQIEIQAKEERYEKEVIQPTHSARNGERYAMAGDAAPRGVARRSLSAAIVSLTAVAMLLAPAGAHAGGGAAWHFEPALAPPQPEGVAPAPYPVAVGSVGAISFWAPNRGLLITGGTRAGGGVVPAGLYAYDGVSWHQLASVCGGAKGRIAWAGPDEFWTISDQRAGQIVAGGQSQGDLEALSLCHFQGDQVVGSYAMPLGEPDSYMEMDAAACLSSSDCWFAGQDGQPPNVGSFHLHWNGSEVSTVYDSSDHAVTGMTSFDGKLYEGLAIDAEDSYLPEEEESSRPLQPPLHPPVIRTIAPAGQTQLCAGAQSSFCNAFLFSVGQTLPLYPERTLPDALGGFDLATDGSPLGAGATQLWAGADPLQHAPAGSGIAKVTILHDLKGTWTQVLPAANGSSTLPEGSILSGSTSDVSQTELDEPGSGSIAPMPGTESAWLSLDGGADTAQVALLEANGAVAAVDELPEAGEDVGFRGTAGPIACPALNDCWMASNPTASTAGGWLFHLTDGAPLESDTDPLFDGEDPVIASRPLDSGVPVVYPDGFAEDDSLANQQPAPAPTAPPEETTPLAPKAKKAKPLVKDVKSRFLHHRTLVIAFTLTAKAHVQLIARAKGRVVAETREASLRAGSHQLSLTLDPARWPTKLSFEAKPIGVSPSSQSGSESSNLGDTVGT